MNSHRAYLQFISRLTVLLAVISGLLGLQFTHPVQAAEGDNIWINAVGGIGNEYGIDITVDDSGSIYIVGGFEGTVDFDPGVGTNELASAGYSDIFITKLDNNGNLVWVKAVGGPDSDEGSAIAVDTSGNVYVTGGFEGTADFDPGVGITELTSEGSWDIFILKLDNSGNFVWAKTLGSTLSDGSNDIFIDSSGNVYITGYFQESVDFDPGTGTFELTSTGGNDIFVSKLDDNGTYIWSVAMGGPGNDGGRAIAVDSYGKIYATGSFEGTVDFDPGAGSVELASAGDNDIFVSKLDSSGSFVWATNPGSSDRADRGTAITLDNLGNIYITGTLNDYDIFVSKLENNGSVLWTGVMEGDSVFGGGNCISITVDVQGNVYTSGQFYGTVDFDPGAGIYELTSAFEESQLTDYDDIFISKLDSDGNYMWAVAIGNTGEDYGTAITIDNYGAIYTTGYFEGNVDFDPGPGITELTSVGEVDMFVGKWNGADLMSTVPLDVVLVIDASESMTYDAAAGNPMRDPSQCNPIHDCQPFENVKGAARAFVQQLSFPIDRVAVVTFDDDARVDLGFSDTRADVLTALDNLNVIEPEVCPTTLGPCREYARDEFGNIIDTNNDGVGDIYYGFDCPAFHVIGDPSTCTTTAIGQGLLYAGNEFVNPATFREGSRRVVILLSDGAANAPSFVCPPSTWLNPFCRDHDATTRHCNTTDAASCLAAGGVYNPDKYDADDYARDMADFISGDQSARIYTIGLGSLVQTSIPIDVNGWGAGEQLLRYAAEVGSGEYYYAPSVDQLLGIFLDVFNQINSDTAPPAVTSITLADPSPTSAVSVDFTVTFSEAVTGVDTSDFSLTSTVTGASILTITDTGSQAVYTVTVDTGSGGGTIRLDLNAFGTGIEDLAGNPISGGFTGGETYTIDVSSANLFEPYVNYPVEMPYAVGVGDFNNDGLFDAALTNTDGELRVFFQNQTGSLDFPTIYPTGARPESLAVGDLNDDGRDDIVVTNFSDNTISVFIQQADGFLANRVTYVTGAGPDAVAVGDVNSDGLDDVAVSNWNSAYISVFIQNANGTLNAKVDYASPQAGYDDIAVSDVNGDNLNDVVKMNGQGLNPQLSVFLQNESGTLASAVSYSLTNCETFCLGNGIGLGDVTGDGKIDVVMSYGGNRPYAQIAVFAQAEDGSLLSAISYSAYDIPEPVKVADVNGDDMADVVTTHGGWDVVGVYAQRSNGLLGDYSLYPLRENSASHFKPQALAIGDINNDGLPDVLVANLNYGLDILYHINPGSPPPVVTSITRTDANPTDAASVGFMVTFDKAVTGVDLTDFTLNITGTVSGASVQTVTGSNNIYEVAVNTGLGEGTIRLDVINNNSIHDIYGNPLDGGYTGGEIYTVIELLSAGLFEPYVNYPVELPYAVGVGDFNNDGRLDAAVTNDNEELRVFIQNQSGGLDAPMIYATGAMPASLAVGDLNDDGRDDIVVANRSNNTISVFIQQSDGSLANQVTYATGAGPDAIAVGDLNSDGLDDVAVSNWNSAYISVFIQNTDGTLDAKVDYASPQAGYDDIAIGDVNGDDLNDVVKMNGQGYANPDLSVYLQTENGTLTGAVSYSLPGNILGNGIGLGDVTGDGQIDVVMSYGGNTPSAKVAVFAQSGDGSLLPAVSYNAYDVPEPVEVADINLDGLSDIVIAHGGWDAVSVHAQHSIGVLGGYSLYPLLDNSASHFGPQALAIGDVNHDNLPDVLVANLNFGLDVLYHVYLDLTPPTVTSIIRADPSPTSASSVDFTVTFSESVTGVDTADFSLTSTVTDASITAVTDTGDQTIYTVTVDTGSGDGTIRLDVIDDGTILDTANNLLTGGFTSGEEYTILRTLSIHNIDLEAGWNLVSFNVQPVNIEIAAVLASIDGDFNLVYAWDASGAHSESGNWMKYDPAAPTYQNSLDHLDETMGFWIHMLSNETLEVTGYQPVTTQIHLLDDAGGWNLVAYPASVNGALPDVLSDHGVNDDFSLVYAYHANDTADPWKLYDRTSVPYSNDLLELAPGWGYWIKVSANHDWNVEYSTP